VSARLDHGHVRSEAPEHLRELTTDEPAADHDQVLRHAVQLHDARIVEPRHISQSIDGRLGRTRARVQDDLPGDMPLAVDVDRAFADEAGVPVRKREPVTCALKSLLHG
jgi:hypothetical protein